METRIKTAIKRNPEEQKSNTGTTADKEIIKKNKLIEQRGGQKNTNTETQPNRKHTRHKRTRITTEP